MRSKRLLAVTGVLALAFFAAAGPAAASPTDTGTAPTATTQTGAATSPVKALVSVLVNPLGLLTNYDVEYGTTTTYGQTTPVRTLAATLGLASYQVPLEALTPSTIYHFRVVATNLLGTAYGQDQTFATWPDQIPFLSKGRVSRNNVENKASGPRAGRSPFGWVLLIHGGGWRAVGSSAVATEDGHVAFYRKLGWATDNVDYREGERSLPDVLAAYDALRKKVGRQMPICVSGDSAGGNLALLAAEHRASISCVISEAGPTDLASLPDETAYTPAPPEVATFDPALTFENFVVPSFGINPSVLEQWSPVDHARKLRVPVLLGASTYDEFVPQAQMAELSDAMNADGAPGVIETLLLPGANTPAGHSLNFTHGSVTSGAMTRWQHAVRQTLRQTADR